MNYAVIVNTCYTSSTIVLLELNVGKTKPGENMRIVIVTEKYSNVEV